MQAPTPSGLTYFAQLIAYQVPTLLAGLLGVILSIVFNGRHRIAAALALLGSVTLIFAPLLVVIAQTYFFSVRFDSGGLSSSSYTQLSTIVGWIGALARGLAIALLVVAVFVGRKRAPAA
jgi:purine-cytosine permease-like protein